MDIKFDLLSHNEIEKFQIFIKLHWKNDHIFVKNKDLFDWQHKGKSKYHCMITTIDKDIVAVHGVIPLNHFDNNLKSREIFIALWRVVENKGIGIGIRMFQKILDTYNPNFIAGLPLNLNVLKFYERFGFRCETLEHHVFISTKKTNFKVANVPRTLELNSIRNKYNCRFEKFDESSLKENDTSSLYRYQTPLKSDNYLINRYLKHPLYDYSIYSVFINSAVKILVVVRPIKLRGSIILTIVDYVGSNDNFHLLPSIMSFLCDKYEAEYVDLYSYGIPKKTLNEVGLLNVQKIKSLIIPGLFEPYEKRNINIVCGFYTKNTKVPVRIFKGDSDADRPSKIKN